jgi:FkbM family methyltransferase
MEEQVRARIVDVLQATASPVVVELGAQDGDDTYWLYPAAGPNATYVAVEPDPRNAVVFRERFGRTNIRFRPYAVNDQNGNCILHLCDNDTGQELASSSICRPTGHLEHFPWCRFDKEFRVPCVTLDELFSREQLNYIDVLWVDIQGAENRMIRAGRDALWRTRYMFLEAETKELYEGQALRDELLAMLPEWDIVEEFEWNLLLKNRLL